MTVQHFGIERETYIKLGGHLAIQSLTVWGYPLFLWTVSCNHFRNMLTDSEVTMFFNFWSISLRSPSWLMISASTVAATAEWHEAQYVSLIPIEMNPRMRTGLLFYKLILCSLCNAHPIAGAVVSNNLIVSNMAPTMLVTKLAGRCYDTHDMSVFQFVKCALCCLLLIAL